MFTLMKLVCGATVSSVPINYEELDRTGTSKKSTIHHLPNVSYIIDLDQRKKKKEHRALNN